MIKNRTINWFVLFLLVGFLLRNFHLEEQSLWMDEGYTLETITWKEEGINNAQIVWNRAVERESTPPAYFLMMYYWTQLMGFSHRDLRFPSVVFSTGSLIFIFLIAKFLHKDNAGLIAMLLAVVAMPEITIAQEARVYAIFGFFALASTYFYLLSFFKQPQKIRNFCLYSLFMFLTLFFHYFGLIVLFLHIFILSLLRKKNLTFIMFSIIPLISFVISLNGIWQIQLNNNFIFLVKWLLKNHIPLTTIWIFIFFIGFVCLFLLFNVKSVPKWFSFIVKSKFFIFILGLTFIAILFSPILFSKSAFYLRYTYFFFPVLYVYLGIMIERIKNANVLGALLFFLMLLMLFFGFYAIENRKEQWLLVAQHIAEREQDEDIIFLIDRDLGIVFKYYYTGKLNIIKSKSTSNETANWNQWNAVRSLISGNKGIWFIESHNTWSGTFWDDMFNETYDLKSYGQYTGINLYYYGVRNVTR